MPSPKCGWWSILWTGTRKNRGKMWVPCKFLDRYQQFRSVVGKEDYEWE